MNRPKLPQCRFAVLIVFALMGAVLGLRAQVPSMIHYQGRVSVGGIPFSGTGLFKFALIRKDTGASTWSNDGTSVSGSEPTAAVSLTVASGLYSLNLGDTTISSMIALPASAVSASQVVLRIWFNDGVRGSAALTPDLPLASVPYSLVAASVPNGSITPAQLGAGTVSGAVTGCNVGADRAEIFVEGMNVYCRVGAGTPTGGFPFSLIHVPAGSHTLTARLPNGTTLSQGIVVAQGGTLSAVAFNFGCGSCGDGIVQTDRGEACDDGNTSNGDGCTAACQIEVAVCGNGAREPGEECDDGNVAAGDGCSALCKVEPVGEVEPNNTTGTANTGFTIGSATPVRVIAGSIGSTGDEDYFQLVVSDDSVLHFEIFDGTGTECWGSMATTLEVQDLAGQVLVSDDDSGINGCSAITCQLNAGTYRIHVREFSNSLLIPAYRLKITRLAPGGTESEPNNQLASANLIVGSQVFIRGNHAAAFDDEWFRLTLYETRSLRIELIEGDTAKSCDDSTIDSLLEVYSSTGVMLNRDDDSGRGYCSIMDGTGASPLMPELHNMSPGIYYIRVSASPTTDVEGSVFAYRLTVDQR